MKKRQSDYGGGDILDVTARPPPSQMDLADQDRFPPVFHALQVLKRPMLKVAGTVNGGKAKYGGG